MRFLSVCSGMEAASVAWEPLGFKAVGFSEIEPFPCAILKHRFPNTQNYGSLTEYQSWSIEQGSVDLLVGGTPCQSFSVAGLRKGLEDPRGNLALTFLGLADKLRPRWIVWENVPGVLSSNGGRDFGAFLGALGQLGYGWAYRVLDAQHFGVPQRRRRVFVVATSTGDGRLAGEVLSLPEGLRGYLETRQQKGKGVAADAGAGVEADGPWWDGRDTAHTLTKKGAGGEQRMPDKGNFGAVIQPIPYRKAKRAASTTDDELGDTRTTHAVVEPTQHCSEVAPTVTNSGPPYSRTGNERVEAEALVTQPIAFTTEQTPKFNHDQALTLTKQSPTGGGQPQCVAQPITFQPGNLRREAGADPSTEATTTLKATPGDQMPHVCYPLKDPNDIACDADRRQNGIGENGDPAFTLRTAVTPGVATSMAVRRLTPVECERLQGFPDNWSRIPWKGKPEEECPDGPRYKACGNSMAVPVMRWIGKRIAEVDAKLSQTK